MWVNGGTYPDYSGTAYEYWSNKSVPVFNFNTGNATIKNTTITFRDGDNMGLCVDGGTVALGEGTVVKGPVSAVTGTVTITEGKYSGAITADQATLKISGGIFAVKPAAEYCAEGFIPTANTDEATKAEYPYAVKQGAFIAQIGDTGYETLQDAINACEAGTETTIKLLDNVTDGAGFAIPDGVTNKKIIIDFDGKSYNVTKGAVGSTGTTTQAMHFYSGNTLTLKNGTITSAATSDENKLKMMMQNYCDLTLDGMTIDCSNVNPHCSRPSAHPCYYV